MKGDGVGAGLADSQSHEADDFDEPPQSKQPAAASQRSQGRARRSPPTSIFVGLIIGLLLYASTQFAVRDIDLYWHLRAGSELLAGTSPGDIGADWSFAPDPLPWVTTQWLAEVVLRLLHNAGGWSALIAYRTVTAALAVAILSHGTLRGRPTILAAFPFVIASTAAILVSQERPNQATLVGAALLGPVMVRGLAGIGLPRWWLLLPGTWLWANYHGGWILVPGVLLLLSFARVLDHGIRDRTARRSLLLGFVALLVGTLTPAGTESTFATLRFSAAAELIQEWMRTVPLADSGLLVTAMVFVIAVGWARSTIPRSEVVVTVVLVVFSWTAVRNVAPALLIISPLVAERLSLAFPKVGRDPEPRWSAPLGVAIACVMTVAGIATIPGRSHLPVEQFPVSLARQIGEMTGPQRVLNDYNVAGFILYFAKPEDQVAIDGRTDRYGAKYIKSYVGLKDLTGEWESLLTELDPTVALLEADSALAHVLVTEKSWTLASQDGNWVLLTAPSADA
jgi:hypothetical protein